MTCGWTWRAPKLMTGSGSAAVDALARRGGPAGRLREHAEDGGLVEPEGAVAAADPQHDLLRLEEVAIDSDSTVTVVGGRVLERVGQEDLGLVDAAEHARHGARRPP